MFAIHFVAVLTPSFLMWRKVNIGNFSILQKVNIFNLVILKYQSVERLFPESTKLEIIPNYWAGSSLCNVM
jgi:hypothetical protein